MDLTQSDLALLSDVSQSTIAKIEQGSINPSYKTMVRILEVLMDEADRQRAVHKVGDISFSDVVKVDPEAKVRIASDTMRRTGFSQLPVMDGDVPVGSISEHGIMDRIRNGMTMDEVGEMDVGDIMEEIFPVVPWDLPVDCVTPAVSYKDAVLVSKNGKTVGIITRSDLLRLI